LGASPIVYFSVEEGDKSVIPLGGVGIVEKFARKLPWEYRLVRQLFKHSYSRLPLFFSRNFRESDCGHDEYCNCHMMVYCTYPIVGSFWRIRYFERYKNADLQFLVEDLHRKLKEHGVMGVPSLGRLRCRTKMEVSRALHQSGLSMNPGPRMSRFKRDMLSIGQLRLPRTSGGLDMPSYCRRVSALRVTKNLGRCIVLYSDFRGIRTGRVHQITPWSNSRLELLRVLVYMAVWLDRHNEPLYLEFIGPNAHILSGECEVVLQSDEYKQFLKNNLDDGLEDLVTEN